MKNRKILICFLSIFLLSKTYVHSQERYYYAFDEKIFLNEVENKMIISFEQNVVTEVRTLLGSAEIEWQNDRIYIVNVEQEQKQSLTETLRLLEGVKSVQSMYTTDCGLEQGITNEIVMRFNDDVLQQQIDELHQKHLVIVKKATNLRQVVTVPNNADALEIANLYQLSGLVKYSHPNFIAKVNKMQTVPTDPYFINQYYLHNWGQSVNGRSCTAGADINVLQAWDITKGSEDIIIAVIDEGVTSDHPDLPNSRQVRLPGSNFADGDADDPSPVEDDNHGNACAGIIAASHNNEGIAGIAPHCKIMPVRVSNNNPSVDAFADAIIFAKDHGAHILSNSWGYWSPNPNLHPNIVDAIEDAALNGRDGKGCIIVFAAGNTANYVIGYPGFVAFPANVNISGVLAVGASDRNDMQANYSPTFIIGTVARFIDVMAPSHKAFSTQIPTETYDVWTIDIPGHRGYNPVKKGDFEPKLPVVGSFLPDSGPNYTAYTGHFGGTSAAAPQVAGVAALMLSVNPNLTQVEVASIIKSTVRKAGNYDYEETPKFPYSTWNNQMGYGVVDAYAAVNAVLALTCGLSGDIEVSGSDIITKQEELFQIENLPPNATVEWTLGENLEKCSAITDNPICVVFDPKLESCVKSWISATVNYNDVCSQTVHKTVSLWPGVPDVNKISTVRHSQNVPNGCPFRDTIIYDGEILEYGNTYEILQGEWREYQSEVSITTLQSGIIPPQFDIILSGTTRELTTNTSGFPRVQVRLENQCGWSDWQTVGYYPSFKCIEILYSPNPVNGELTIEFIELPDTDQPETYTVKLFDHSGNPRRQTQFRHRRRDGRARPVKFNTTSLPPGTYFLHVEGAGEYVREQIIVTQ